MLVLFLFYSMSTVYQISEEPLEGSAKDLELYYVLMKIETSTLWMLVSRRILLKLWNLPNCRLVERKLPRDMRPPSLPCKRSETDEAGSVSGAHDCGMKHNSQAFSVF